MTPSPFQFFIALVLLLFSRWLIPRCIEDMHKRLIKLISLVSEAHQESNQVGWPSLRRAAPYLVAIGLLLVSFAAAATPADVGILDTVTQQYQNASSGWYAPLFSYANTLFGLLAALEVAWSAATWALEKDNMQSFLSVLIRKIMTIGFFYAVLLNAQTWLPAIVNSLVTAGQTAGGTGSLSPSQVVSAGMDCAFQIMQATSNLGLIQSIVVGIPALLCALIIALAFVWIAGHLAVALIESYIAISANVIFLGFGGSRWTTDFVNKVLGYAMSTGIKLFMTYLIIGLGMTQANTWATMLADTSGSYLQNCFTVVVAALFFAYLATKIPSLAASLLTGSPSLTAGDAAGTIGGMIAGGVVAGATVAGGMKSALAGAANAGSSGGSALAGAAKGASSSPPVAGLGSSGSGSPGTNSIARALPPPQPSGPGPSDGSAGEGASASAPKPAAVQAAESQNIISSSQVESGISKPVAPGGSGSELSASGSVPPTSQGADATNAEYLRTAGQQATVKGGSTPAPIAAKVNMPGSSGVAGASASAAPSAAKATSSAPVANTQGADASAAEHARVSSQQSFTGPDGQFSPVGTFDNSGENSIGGATSQSPPSTDEKPQEKKEGLIDKLKRVKAPNMPHDQAPAGTVHIKLDHHD